MGMDMLQARLVKTKVKESEVRSYVNDISVTPLAIPMLCGPGTITNAIVMWNNAGNWEMRGVMVLAIAVEFFFSGLKPIVLDILEAFYRP